MESGATTVRKPPADLMWPADHFSVFLAGSIEMGAAPPWQRAIAEALAERPRLVLLDPRRDDWDPSWDQSMQDPRFRAQVTWELDAQDRADLIVMYFAPETRAPITLLELGLFARSGKLVVCCPAGYWRRGNVQVVCARYGIPEVDTLDGLVAEIVRRYERRSIEK
jgi:hypothetical protein